MLQCSNLPASEIFKNFLDIATINPVWFPRPVLALITHLDGANAQLFHVEHCGNREWQYQIRWPESRVAEYRDWQPQRSTSGERAIEPLLDPGVLCDVRWRWSENGSDGSEPPWQQPWQEARAHEWGDATAFFHVILKQPRDFRADPLVHAAALVRGLPVAFELAMPQRLAAQKGREVFAVPGTALCKGPGTVLREVGEFICVNDAFCISNAKPSQVALLPVRPRLPSALPYQGMFGVRVGCLSPDEVELLRVFAAAEKEVPHG